MPVVSESDLDAGRPAFTDIEDDDDDLFDLEEDIDHVQELIDQILEEEEVAAVVAEDGPGNHVFEAASAHLFNGHDHKEDVLTGDIDDEDEAITPGELLEVEEALDQKRFERPLVDNSHGLKPVRVLSYVEKHHNSKAGSIVTEEKTSDKAYASSIRGNPGSKPLNVWAPSTSRLKSPDDWWWKKQGEVEAKTGNQRATIVPIILSSDKTQLATFRSKTAYPLYLTLGNIPKHVRRKPSHQSHMLLAYLPTSKLEHITNKSSRPRAMANLFHVCVHHVICPLERLGHEGLMLVSGDGAAQHGYPLLAAYVVDYLEQLLVTLIQYWRCPVCPASRDKLGDEGSTQAPREIKLIHTALATVDQGPRAFKKACLDVGIKDVQNPFWRNLPFSNIYSSITPDILHQLYQGVTRHLLSWLTMVIGSAEIDQQCAILPPNHHIHVFHKGISGLLRVTGTEHDQICRFLLALVLDVRLPSKGTSTKITKAVRAILNFLFLALYPVHSSDTLETMSTALAAFQEHRDVFIKLKVQDN
ncbi:hypothetical protein NP233_g11583 [Leucocoprinus birnbaumii]|uniref:Uncharacterized protein n=1 Tax=Leucocoprinus birnbaumii TaxID=56174 RepID=A0AAD5VM28_9AGAR|nr:hypothetical protein NP233_g11583 [Leucocoprinus birnbaumii]